MCSLSHREGFDTLGMHFVLLRVAVSQYSLSNIALYSDVHVSVSQYFVSSIAMHACQALSTDSTVYTV